MKHTRALLCAGLAAASLATPASAQDAAGNSIVYSVTASAPQGAAQLTAGCVFVADRWTADYGPTHVYGAVASSTISNSISITCTVKQWGNVIDSVTAYGNGQYAVIDDARFGHMPTQGVTVCVDAYVTSGVIDVGYQAHRCA